MTNRAFVEMMNNERAGQRDPWVKVRWINIAGISWDVLSALAIKYGKLGNFCMIYVTPNKYSAGRLASSCIGGRLAPTWSCKIQGRLLPETSLRTGPLSCSLTQRRWRARFDGSPNPTLIFSDAHDGGRRVSDSRRQRGRRRTYRIWERACIEIFYRQRKVGSHEEAAMGLKVWRRQRECVRNGQQLHKTNPSWVYRELRIFQIYMETLTSLVM